MKVIVVLARKDGQRVDLCDGLDSRLDDFQNRTLVCRRGAASNGPPPSSVHVSNDIVCARRSTEEIEVKKEDVLAKVAAGEITIEEASKMLDADAPKRGTLYCKVSQKGAISVYGLQRMPVTLYVEQWERLLGFGDEIRSFLKEHDSELKRKER